MQLYIPKVAESSFSKVKTDTALKCIACVCLVSSERRNVFSCSLGGVCVQASILT